MGKTRKMLNMASIEIQTWTFTHTQTQEGEDRDAFECNKLEIHVDDKTKTRQWSYFFRKSFPSGIVKKQFQLFLQFYFFLLFL